jgi:hypothetical protein
VAGLKQSRRQATDLVGRFPQPVGIETATRLVHGVDHGALAETAKGGGAGQDAHPGVEVLVGGDRHQRARSDQAASPQSRRPHERAHHRQAGPQPPGRGQWLQSIRKPLPDAVEHGVGHLGRLAEHATEHGHEVVDVEGLANLPGGSLRLVQPARELSKIRFEHAVAAHGVEDDVGRRSEPTEGRQGLTPYGCQHVGGVLHAVVVPAPGGDAGQQGQARLCLAHGDPHAALGDIGGNLVHRNPPQLLHLFEALDEAAQPAQNVDQILHG